MLTAVMKPSPDIHVIINPASGARRTFRRLPAIIACIERHLPSRCLFALSSGPGDATRLAARAVRSGAPLLIVAGGDGTINESVNGMLEATGGSRPVTSLGVIGCGSGDGFALSLRIPRTLDAGVRAIRDSAPRPVDVGIFSTPGGGEERFFINECQVGIGADVVSHTRMLKKVAGGLIGYGMATFSAIFGSPNTELNLTVDGTEEPPCGVLGLAIGNGDLTGGGMALTPGAAADDGWLNLLTIHAMPVTERLRSFPKIYTGAHVSARNFTYRRMKRCVVNGPNHVPVAADGEMIGHTPCSIAIIEKGILVSAPAPCEGPLL
jgi:diacylglycerol kinase (ATP)